MLHGNSGSGPRASSVGQVAECYLAELVWKRTGGVICFEGGPKPTARSEDHRANPPSLWDREVGDDEVDR